MNSYYCKLPQIRTVSYSKYIDFFRFKIDWLFNDGPQNLISGVQTSRVSVKETISAAFGMTGFFGYVVLHFLDWAWPTLQHFLVGL